MDDFCYEAGFGQEDLERAARALFLGQGHPFWLFAARTSGADAIPALVFADARLLRRFDCRDLKSLSLRLFSEADPGSVALFNLSQVPHLDDLPRLARFRFFLKPTTENLTFLWRHVLRSVSEPLFVAGVADRRGIVLPEPKSDPDHRQAVEAPFQPRILSLDEVRAGWSHVFPEQTKVRFIWNTDAEDRFRQISEALAQVVGLPAANLIGQDFSQLGGFLGVSIPEPFLEAWLQRRTWSDLDLLWPVSNARASVPVRLGAFPNFNADGKFTGYRGFGFFHLDQAVEAQIHQCAWSPAKPSSHDAIVPPETARSETESQETAASISAREPRQSHEDGPANHSNVVALYPLRDLSANGDMETQLEPVSPEIGVPLKSPALSKMEEEAFREIAFSLVGTRILEIPKDDADLAPRIEVDGIEDKNSEDKDSESVAADQASSMDLLSLLDALPYGILVCREKSTLFANHGLLELLGFADLDTFTKTETALTLYNLVPQTRALPLAVRLENATGTWMTVQAQCEPIAWDGQAANRIIVQLGLAGTGAAESETKLQQYANEARELHTILDTATDGVAVLDSNGRILALNRSGEALFGYDQSEVLDKPFTMLIAPESRSRTDDYFKGLQANGVLSLLNDGLEIFGLARQGGTIPLFVTMGRISANRHPDEENAEARIKYCALLRDLTHWKKVELELEDARNQAERASALKSDFLAKVSHEIRTPLNAILGFAEVMMDERFGPIGNERYKDYLKDIHASGGLVMSIVNDLLDLSKIEAGKMELDFAAVDANQIVGECVSIMQPQANREQVIMRLSLASRLPQLFADERSLRQIILNLLSNAIKFNEPGGQVIVATTLTDTRQVLIRIRDTGLGMSEDDVKIALEPFRQLATSRPQGGTGLGLPLTKALIEANRAYFSIRSKKHEGTMVEIAFPSARILAE